MEIRQRDKTNGQLAYIFHLTGWLTLFCCRLVPNWTYSLLVIGGLAFLASCTYSFHYSFSLRRKSLARLVVNGMAFISLLMAITTLCLAFIPEEPSYPSSLSATLMGGVLIFQTKKQGLPHP